MTTRKISAREFVQDVRAGRSRARLMTDHGLSDQAFDKLLSKLVHGSMLRADEVEHLMAGAPQSTTGNAPGLGPAHGAAERRSPRTSPSSSGNHPRADSLPRWGIILIGAWCSGIALITAIGAFVVISMVYHSKMEANIRHAARVDPSVTEPGKTPAERTPPPGHEDDVPADVFVGLYVDRIVELSIRDTQWTVDFYLWFNWIDDRLNPGDTFQVVNGEILSRQELDRISREGEHYALYRVTARITKHFDISRFPCNDHILTVRLEDTALQSYQLRYVPDVQGSTVSSRVAVPGYMIYRKGALVKPHSYKTPRGHPHLPEDFKATYSQFVYGIWIARPSLGFFLKVFQGTYAAVAIALIAFFVLPTNLDPRFGLGVGAFFAAIANTYVAASLLPDAGIITMTDMINGIAMATIFFSLVGSGISLYLYQTLGEQRVSYAFDRASFAVFAVGYVVVNIAIPVAACM